MFRLIYDISNGIKSEDIVAHRAGPAALHFVFVTEEPLSCETSAIIQFTVR